MDVKKLARRGIVLFLLLWIAPVAGIALGAGYAIAGGVRYGLNKLRGSDGKKIDKVVKGLNEKLDERRSNRNNNKFVVGKNDQVQLIPVNGIEDAVRAVTDKKGNMWYSFDVGVEDMAKAMSLVGSSDGKISASRNEKGGWTLSSEDPGALFNAAGHLLEPNRVEVEKKSSVTNQFRVDGCATYEEAVEKLKGTPPAERNHVNTVIEGSVSVNGKVKNSYKSGSELNSSDITSLPPGSFIVSETVTESFKGVATGRKGEDPSDIADRYTPRQSESSGERTEYKNATPADVKRSMVLDGELVNLVPADKLPKGNKAWIEFDSMEGMQNACDVGSIPSGCNVKVGPADAVPKGRYVLEFDLRPEMLEHMSHNIQSGGYPHGLVSDRDLLSSAVASGKTVDVKTNFDLPVSEAKWQGVKMNELSERMRNGNLSKLSAGQMKRWAEGSAAIGKIDVNVDPKTKEMKISAVCDGVMRSSSYPLSDKDMKEYGMRGKFSNVEKKDLFMQLFPTRFQMYKNGASKKEVISNFLAAKVTTKVTTTTTKRKSKNTQNRM